MSVELLLPSSVALGRTSSNIGTPNTGVTALEYGDGRNHVTELTISQVDALTLADNANLRVGYLVYTFPAGAVVLDYAYMSMAIQAASAEQVSDTPEVGLGTVIGSGVSATLSTTFEDIILGTPAAADCNGTPTVKLVLPTAGTPLLIPAADPHTVHFNAADGWGNDLGGDLTADIDGTIVLAWRFMS